MTHVTLSPHPPQCNGKPEAKCCEIIKKLISVAWTGHSVNSHEDSSNKNMPCLKDLFGHPIQNTLLPHCFFAPEWQRSRQHVHPYPTFKSATMLQCRIHRSRHPYYNYYIFLMFRNVQFNALDPRALHTLGP